MEQKSYRSFYRKLAWIFLFGISMGYFEASIVVYLRELYYPEGFSFPLKLIPYELIMVELGREFFSLVMIASVAALSARKLWERFAFFIIIFGVWDIFYYIWLKLTLDWPSSIFDWDVLFLIPLPWIGPVIAPVLIAVLMIVVGIMISRRFACGETFTSTKTSWVFAVMATGIILYSFMRDIDAGLHQAIPKEYAYWMLLTGLGLYSAGFVHAYWKSDDRKKKNSNSDTTENHLTHSPFQP